jgi:transposase
MITSQLCVSGRVKQVQISCAFGITLVSVKRAVKRYREEGPQGFYAVKKMRSASVLTKQVLIEAQLLLDDGLTVKEVAERMELKRDTLLKAARAGKLHVIK